MSRRTRVAPRAPLPLRCPSTSTSLAVALLLAPLTQAACSTADDTGRAAPAPVGPIEDPIVEVVPLEDGGAPPLDGAANEPREDEPGRDGGAAGDAARPPAADEEDDEPEDAADDEGAEPEPPRAEERDAGGPGTTTPTAEVTCVPEATGAGTVLASTPAAVTTAAGSAQVTVRATGNGCPPCTSRTTVAADGQTFTTIFSAFDVTLGDADAASRQCELTITLRSTGERSYGVIDFAYQGYADLAAGQIARQTTRHRFGSPSANDAAETQLSGPRQGAYTYREPIAASEVAWSPCATERTLTVSATTWVSDMQRRAGGISLSATAAQPGAKLELKLDARACDP